MWSLSWAKIVYIICMSKGGKNVLKTRRYDSEISTHFSFILLKPSLNHLKEIAGGGGGGVGGGGGGYTFHSPFRKPKCFHHECEGGAEKSVWRITVWHHEACRVMTNGEHEGLIFLSHSHMNNGFFFLLTIKFRILCLNKGPQKFLDTLRHDIAMTSICASSNTTNVQLSRDSLGKITWVRFSIPG